MAPGSLTLIDPLSTSCFSVIRAIRSVQGLTAFDLGQLVADELGTRPDLILAAASENDYRRIEALTTERFLERAEAGGLIVALGSDCLEVTGVCQGPERLRLANRGAHHVTSPTYVPRVLTTRNGLNVPWSVTLGTIHHRFAQMLHERQVRCQDLADAVVDTASTTPGEVGEKVTNAIGTDLSHYSRSVRHTRRRGGTMLRGRISTSQMQCNSEETLVATTNDLKNGMVFNLEDQLWQVVEFRHVKPGKGLTFVRTKTKSVLSGKTVDKTFNTSLKVETATVNRCDAQYLYKDGDDYVFMDIKPYEQTYVSSATVGKAATSTLKNREVTMAFHEDSVLFIGLPASAVLTISRTELGPQGDRPSVDTRPATVETGAEIQIPLFPNAGDKVKVDTHSDSYISRIND